MKLMYGSVPVKSMNIHTFEMDTNDCTAIPSDLQVGVTCVAKGKKIIGTGKCFEFASYGTLRTNFPEIIPFEINTVFVSCVDYPIKMTAPMIDMIYYDFSVARKIADIIVDGTTYPVSICIQNGELIVECEKNIDIELFIGKDNYI